MAREPLREPVMHAMYNQVAGGLLDAGFRSDETLAIITATESFILGSALDAAAPSVMFDDVRGDINPTSPRSSDRPTTPAAEPIKPSTWACKP